MRLASESMGHGPRAAEEGSLGIITGSQDRFGHGPVTRWRFAYTTRARARSSRSSRLEPGKVTMYVCGPTVYNYAHIGNARPPVVFDVLARLLRRSFELTYVRNVTDVDDKINAAAKAEGVDIGVLTDRYLQAYLGDMDALGVMPPDIAPRVTGHMPEIVAMIETLVASGHAYEAEGHVLFAVSRYQSYGALSGRDRDELIAGARVEVAPYKQDPADFVLWKPSPDDLVGWDSPWGRGRPGWHIECSAMAEAHLGRTIDIHGGGQDLVFPHHENEVAQSTCAHDGELYCRYWIHNGLDPRGQREDVQVVGQRPARQGLVERGAGRGDSLGAADGALSSAARLDGHGARRCAPEARSYVRRVALGRDHG